MNTFLKVSVLIVSVAQIIYSASVCDEITFVTRAQWGARKATTTIGKMSLPMHHVFMHHTQEPDQCLNQTVCTADLKWIQNLHIDTNGWSDIGYNFILGGDDRIYEGRGWDEIGAHTKGINDKSVALSLIGSYMSVDPPQAMLDLAQKWIQCGIEKGVIASNYQLHGHRDQTCTDCPGDHFYAIVKTWKQFVGGPLQTYVCS